MATNSRPRRPLIARLRLVLALPIVIQSAYVILPMREVWPFATFPMYSGRHGTRADWLSVRGVTARGSEIDLDLSVYWYPLDNFRVRTAIQRALAKDRPKEESLAPLLRALAHRYEDLRLAHAHPGDRIEGLRVYRVLFDWSRGVADVRESRELLFDTEHEPAPTHP